MGCAYSCGAYSEGMSTNRDNVTGRYVSKFTRVCKCGALFGVHDALKPWARGDGLADSRDEEMPECEGFKHNKKATPEMVEAARIGAGWTVEEFTKWDTDAAYGK